MVMSQLSRTITCACQVVRHVELGIVRVRVQTFTLIMARALPTPVDEGEKTPDRIEVLGAGYRVKHPVALQMYSDKSERGLALRVRMRFVLLVLSTDGEDGEIQLILLASYAITVQKGGRT
jgi:hypothetical protein